MKISELTDGFEIYKSNEETKILEKLHHAMPLSYFNERDRFVIENLIRKSLVIKIGNTNPTVIANEL